MAATSELHYATSALLLVGGGLGVPIPEEVVVLSAGLVAAQGKADPFVAAAVCYAGILAGDLLLYWIGRALGVKALEHRHFKRLLTPERVKWITGHFHRRGMLTIALARVTAGLRAPTFLVAGISRFSVKRFLAADALVALVTVPLLVFLGFHFGAQVTHWLHKLKVWEHAALAGLAVYALTKALLAWHRRARRERSGVADKAAALERQALEQTVSEGPPGRQPA